MVLRTNRLVHSTGSTLLPPYPLPQVMPLALRLLVQTTWWKSDSSQPYYFPRKWYWLCPIEGNLEFSDVKYLISIWTPWEQHRKINLTNCLVPSFPNVSRSLSWVQFSSVQSLSLVWLFATPRIAARQASLSITISQSSLKLTFSDAIQPSHPLSSPSPPAPNPSQHQCLFHWVNSSHEVAKVLEFQL